MAWHLTVARRDAVVLEMLGKALRALDEAPVGHRRREARLWIDRAIEVSRTLAGPDASPIEQARIKAVEAVLDRIAVRLCSDIGPRGRRRRLTTARSAARS